MSRDGIPELVDNYIDGRGRPAASGRTLEKLNPATGGLLCRLARSEPADVDEAVAAAVRAQPAWGAMPGVARGMKVHDLALAFREHREAIARTVALETGKSFRDALGETDGAVALGLFFAGEGQRLYGRTTTSAVAGRHLFTVRRPVGVAGLIVAANTPVANVAWKIFPALVCGNAVVLKAAEDAPATARAAGAMADAAGLPPGVLNVVQGLGEEAGAPLAAHPDVGVVSFTGSTRVGRLIARAAGERLAKVSLELGGKNPFVVCDDADLEHAARWAALSAFGNAGQRCASASRIIVFEAVYERFRELLVRRARSQRVGTGDDDDFGPVINARQLEGMLGAVREAREAGATVLVGGERLAGPAHAGGCFMAPTLIEGADPGSPIAVTELFGPIACLFPARDFEHALALANDSPYGLTSAVHSRSVHRVLEFARRVRAGVVVANAGTFGSEPHMPFGGVGISGNGTREPGTEALDVYTELKNLSLNADPGQV